MMRVMILLFVPATMALQQKPRESTPLPFAPRTNFSLEQLRLNAQHVAATMVAKKSEWLVTASPQEIESRSAVARTPPMGWSSWYFGINSVEVFCEASVSQERILLWC
jgi:hypothetical protein